MKKLMSSNVLDRCGITVSGLCGVHCVALVALSIFQPVATWGGQRSATLHMVELILISAATAFAAIALVSGYRHHGHTKPVSLGVIGLATLWGVATTTIHENQWAPLLTALGGMSLILSHKWNIKCRCVHSVKPSHLHQ